MLCELSRDQRRFLALPAARHVGPSLYPFTLSGQPRRPGPHHLVGKGEGQLLGSTGLQCGLVQRCRDRRQVRLAEVGLTWPGAVFAEGSQNGCLRGGDLLNQHGQVAGLNTPAHEKRVLTWCPVGQDDVPVADHGQRPARCRVIVQVEGHRIRMASTASALRRGQPDRQGVIPCRQIYRGETEQDPSHEEFDTVSVRFRPLIRRNRFLVRRPGSRSGLPRRAWPYG